MFDQQQQTGEQPETRERSTSADMEKVQQGAETKAPDQTDGFVKAVDAKTKAYEEKVEKLEKKYKARWSIAETKTMLITDRWKNDIRLTAAAKKEQFAKLAKEEKAQRMSIMLGETEQNLANLYYPYEKIVDHVRGLDKLDEKELVKLEALLKALSSMKANPEMERIFMKSLNKEALDQKEMEYLVAQIKPVNLNQSIKEEKGDEVFEASQVGAIISTMGEGQKLELIGLIFSKKPAEEGRKILDALITSSQISNLQLKSLLDSGRIPEPHAAEIRKQLEAGELSKRQMEYQKRIDDMGELNKGRTHGNSLSKTIGGPGAFAAMSIWGAATAIINYKLSIGGGVGNVLSNEYFLLGMGVAGLGVAGTASVVAPEKYDAIKEKFVGFFSGPEEKKNKKAIEKSELQGFIEQQMKRNPYLMDFLAEKEEFPGGSHKTGLEIINDLVSEKQTKKEAVSFSFEELYARSGRRQKEFLTKAYGLEGSKDVNLQDSIRNIMAGLFHLQMDNPESFTQVVRNLKTKQGIA